MYFIYFWITAVVGVVLILNLFLHFSDIKHVKWYLVKIHKG